MTEARLQRWMEHHYSGLIELSVEDRDENREHGGEKGGKSGDSREGKEETESSKQVGKKL